MSDSPLQLGGNTELREPRTSVDISVLKQAELFWAEHQQYLQSQGYMLRKRYRPGWVASWKSDGMPDIECEDSVTPYVRFISLAVPMSLNYMSKRRYLMDAERISDGELVMLKKVSKETHSRELQIAQYFAVEPLVSHPSNHCVPFYDILHVPDDVDCALLVMPVLRIFDNPPFNTVGEVIEALRQLLEVCGFSSRMVSVHIDRYAFLRVFSSCTNVTSLIGMLHIISRATTIHTD